MMRLHRGKLFIGKCMVAIPDYIKWIPGGGFWNNDCECYCNSGTRIYNMDDNKYYYSSVDSISCVTFGESDHECKCIPPAVSITYDKDDNLLINGKRCNSGGKINGHFTCVDCEGCDDCYFCVGCIDCHDCYYCVSCTECTNFKGISFIYHATKYPE